MEETLRKSPALLLSAALLAAAVAQNTQISTWSDTAGNMKIENWTSWRITKTGENTYDFKGSGSPFRGTWKEQGLMVLGKSVTGKTKKEPKGAMQLVAAEVLGVQKATLTETPKSGIVRTTELQSTTLQFNGETSTVTLPNPVTVISRSPAESQTLELHGSSAKLILTPFDEKAEWPVKFGEVFGPVTMTLDTLERVEKKEGEEPKPPKRIQVTAKASKVTFNDADRTIVLSGNVTLDGSDTVIGANVRCTKAVITLNAAREIVDIELTGNPGVTEMRDGAHR